MSFESENETKRKKMSRALQITGITLALMVAVYVVIYAFKLEAPLIYAVVPFVIAYWLSVVWLSVLAYSWFMGAIAFVSPILPGSTFVIMLLAYSRASRFLKQPPEVASVSAPASSTTSQRRAPTL
ncbi:hypothetical protein [Hydrocarboniphaga effusa]|jgi:hypothetical protein|uniref:hypothetical protein n=1 Tax=Hydrocarboniphaga effusa TaxID=243629 RepID=UPI0035B46B96